MRRRTPGRSGNPDRLWFAQEVEVQPGGDFLVSVEELVRVPEVGVAERAFLLDRADLVGVAGDDDLLTAGG